MLKNKKNKEWKRFKLSGNTVTYDVVRAEFDYLNIQLYNDYVEKIATDAQNDSSAFRQFVNSKRKTDNIANSQI